MDAKVDEIGDGIFRVSVFVPHVLPPAGITFNEFIILADEPLLFHCGHRKLFPISLKNVDECEALHILNCVTHHKRQHDTKMNLGGYCGNRCCW